MTKCDSDGYVDPVDAESFWDLSPDVRLSVAGRAGLFRNDYEESLAIARRHEISADLEAVALTAAALRWDDPDKVWDDAGIDYHPESPLYDAYDRAYLVMCGDCYGSPVSENEDGYAGIFCEVCERRRSRRGLD